MTTSKRHPLRVTRFPETGRMEYTCQSCGHRNDAEWRIGLHECDLCHFEHNDIRRASFVWDGTHERKL